MVDQARAFIARAAVGRLMLDARRRRRGTTVAPDVAFEQLIEFVLLGLFYAFIFAVVFAALFGARRVCFGWQRAITSRARDS